LHSSRSSIYGSAEVQAVCVPEQSKNGGNFVFFPDGQHVSPFVSLLRGNFYAQNRLRGSGHGIAAARMDAKLNVAGWISEQMGGVRWCNLEFL